MNIPNLSQIFSNKPSPPFQTFQCNLCDYKQSFYLRPKLRKSTTPSSTSTEVHDTKQRKKKKKNKTRFAGLDRHVMQNLGAPEKAPIKKTPEMLKKEKKAKAKLNQQPTAKKATKVDQGVSAKARALSKNSMMQLAQLLKNKDSNTSVNRLEMMFK